MASLTVTSAWSDPSASLTADQVYIVQNKSGGWLRFFDEASFDPDTNAHDGVALAPLNHKGSAPNHIRWKYIATNQVRLKLDSEISGETARVEFALQA